MKSIFFVTGLILVSYVLFAENDTDSLLDCLDTATYKSEIYNQLFDIYINQDIKKARQYIDSALYFAKKDNQKNQQIIAMNNYGIFFIYSRNFDSSEMFLNQALNLSLESSDSLQIINTYSNLGSLKYYQGQYTEALDYFQKGLVYANDSLFPKKSASLYNNIATIQQTLGNLAGAIEMYKKSLELKIKLNDSSAIAYTYNNLGMVYNKIGDHSKAMDYFIKALKFLNSANIRLKATIFNNIAGIHYKTGYYSKANDYYLMSLKLKKQMNDDKGCAKTYNNLGSVFEALKQYDKAIEYYSKAEDIFTAIKSPDNLAATQNNIGSALEQQQKYAQAYEYYSKALEVSEKTGNPDGIITALINIANLNLKINNLTNVGMVLNRASELAEEQHSIYYLSKIYSLFAKYFEKKHNFQQAYQYQKKYTIIKDSLFNKEKFNAINDLNIKYETEKKELQIKSLTQKNQILQKEKEIKDLKLAAKQKTIWAITVAIILIIITFALIFRSVKLKAETKQLAVEQKLLRSSMNPHFIFNALTSIQGTIYKGDTKTTGKYLSKFARLMRNILETTKEEFIPIEKEMEIITQYLDLQKLRFNDKFDYAINLEEEIDQDVLIPPMLLQPILENAIKHAFVEQNQGLIEINIKKRNKKLIIEITDDGKGIEVEPLKNKKHKSLAISIIRQRINLLNKKFTKKNRFLFSLQNRINYDGKEGTIAIFEIPIDINYE